MSKAKRNLDDVPVKDMSAEELDQRWSELQGLYDAVNTRQHRYEAKVAEVAFFLEVVDDESETHARFFRSNVNGFLGAEKVTRRLSRQKDVMPKEGDSTILEAAGAVIESMKLQQQKEFEEQAERRRVEESRVKKAEEERLRKAEDERKALEEKRATAAETGSRPPGAEPQQQGHTAVPIPSTPPSSVYERRRDYTAVPIPSTPPSSVYERGRDYTAVPIPSTKASSVHEDDLTRRVSSVQSVREPGRLSDHNSVDDDGLSSSSRSSSDSSSLYKAQGHAGAAAGGGTTERRIVPSSSSSGAFSSRDSEEFNDVERVEDTNSSQLRADDLDAVQRDPGKHHEEWHSRVQRQDLDEVHKSLGGSAVDEEEHHTEYGRGDHEFPAPQESSMDFDQEPIRVFSISGEGRNYVEGAMRDFLSSQYHGSEEAFRNMSVSELKGRLNDKHSDVVDALSAQIERDYREKKLKPIEGRAAPSIPVQGQTEPDEVTTYTFKGRTLTQTEHQADGKISFSAEPGLNAVVRIQRRDRSGELIEAFDTVEYKNGQVAALVMGKGGESRLADIGLMRSQIQKRGGVEFGVEDKQDLPLEPSRISTEASVRESMSTEQEKRTIPSSTAAGGGADFEAKKMAKAEADVSVLRKRPANLGFSEGGDFSVFRAAPSTPSVASSKKKGRGAD